jgi:phage tail sheath protein FI
MPVTPTYPGVYIEEVPSGVRTIVGVATSITAFIDFFKRGPMNRAVQIFNMGDFERIFGGLDTRSEASYAIQQFFLNGGTEAWVVRVASGSPAKATVSLQNEVSGTTVLTVSASEEGEWGNNLRIGVSYNPDLPTDRFNLVVSEVINDNGQIKVARQESFQDISMADVQAVIEDTSSLINVIPSGYIRPLASGTISEDVTSFPIFLPGSNEPLRVEVTFTIDGISESANANLGYSPIASLEEAATRLEAAIRNAKPGNATWAKTTVRVVGNRLQVIAGLSAPRAIITFGVAPAGDSFSADNSTVVDLQLNTAGVTENVAHYQIGSSVNIGAQVAGTPGNDGDPPDAMALIGSQATDPPTGLYALDKVSLFNLLCIPRISRVSGSATSFEEAQVNSVISAARNYCEVRRAFFILDTPSNVNNVPQIKEWLKEHDSLRHANLAIYFPRVLFPDPLSEFRPRSFGASGIMAGLYAKTDSSRGVWKAPAGTEVTLPPNIRLAYEMTDPENGTLNPLGINCLRTFPVYGNVSWGARTLVGADQIASEWKYIPIRRLALFIEESLYRGTKWVVFEPNDEPLWAKIRLNVGAFMTSLFRQGAFQGTTPNKAFYVKCDSETTTQDDRNRGIVNIEVGFAPLKPAEFVIIRIQQMAGDLV